MGPDISLKFFMLTYSSRHNSTLRLWNLNSKYAKLERIYMIFFSFYKMINLI